MDGGAAQVGNGVGGVIDTQVTIRSNGSGGKCLLHCCKVECIRHGPRRITTDVVVGGVGAQIGQQNIVVPSRLFVIGGLVGRAHMVGVGVGRGAVKNHAGVSGLGGQPRNHHTRGVTRKGNMNALNLIGGFTVAHHHCEEEENLPHHHGE